MADKKISQLTSLAQGDIATTTDVLAIVDTSATETKKATPAAIVGAAAAAGLTNVDINSGAIDGTTIGANSAAAGTFTNLTASGTVSFSGATVSNGGSVTTVDINGGTIDGASVGASSASSGAFTTLSASGNVTLSGGTANGVLYLNGSKVATSGSALTFDGSQTFKIRQNTSGLGNYSELLLDVSNSFNGTGQSYLRNVSLNGGNSSTALAFGVNADGGVSPSEQMRLTSTGLGIGTSSPGYKLHVAGTQRIEKSGAGYEAAMLSFATITETGAIYRMGMASGGAFIIGRSDTATTNLTLDVSGNLGIGTTSPAVPLDVVSNSGSNGINIRARSSNDYGFLNFKSNDGSDTAGSIAALRAGVNSGSLLFYTGTTEKARLDTSGNLGIGTSSPSYKLDVAGDARSNSWIGRANGSAPTADCAVFRPADNSLGFSTANTERARLDSSGNLGIGTTSPITSAGGGLTVGSTSSGKSIAIYSSDNGNNGLLRLYQSSGVEEGQLYAGNGTLTLYSSSVLRFGTNNLERARIDASGNFGVNITNPASYAKAAFVNTAGSSALYAGSTTQGVYISNSTGTDVVYNSSGNSAGSHVWQTGNTERARIDASGNLLVGTTGGDGRISIKPGVDSGALRVYDSGGTGRVYLLPDETYGYQYVSTIKTNGNYAMRIENSSATLVGGIVTNASSVSYNTTSDRRLKENIIEADDTGAIFDSIKIIKHDWKNGGHTRYGVIAQDLHAVVPEAVKVGDSNETVTDPWGVDYSKLVPMLVKEIQSLRARVAQLEAK